MLINVEMTSIVGIYEHVGFLQTYLMISCLS